MKYKLFIIILFMFPFFIIAGACSLLNEDDYFYYFGAKCEPGTEIFDSDAHNNPDYLNGCNLAEDSQVRDLYLKAGTYVGQGYATLIEDCEVYNIPCKAGDGVSLLEGNFKGCILSSNTIINNIPCKAGYRVYLDYDVTTEQKVIIKCVLSENYISYGAPCKANHEIIFQRDEFIESCTLSENTVLQTRGYANIPEYNVPCKANYNISFCRDTYIKNIAKVKSCTLSEGIYIAEVTNYNEEANCETGKIIKFDGCTEFDHCNVYND